MEQEINLNPEAFKSALSDRHLRELSKFETRYIFLPFAEVSHPSLDGKTVPAGEIFALDAPRRPIPMRDLPMDNPATVVEHSAGPNKDIAFYLDEPGPILASIIQSALTAGAVEITELKGMQGEQFQALKLNDIIFGLPRPTTAAALVARMNEVLQQSARQKGEAGEKLASIAKTILGSVKTCANYCKGVLQETHADMDTAKTGNLEAKRQYDRRDLRAIEFIGAIPREQQMLAIAQEQREQAAALPSLLERMDQRDAYFAMLAEGMKAITGAQWGEIANGMIQAMNAQTEMLKAIAANSGAQPAADSKKSK